jgi:hypothetical protein
VHGISREFLLDKPRFADIAAEFLDFVRGPNWSSTTPLSTSASSTPNSPCSTWRR